jgi:hypothetical protein
MEKMELLPITDVDKEVIENFDCALPKYSQYQVDLKSDHEKINHFLKEEALTHHLNYFARTYLLVNEEFNEVIGFFSLYNEELKISNGQKRSFKFKGTTFYKGESTDVFPAVRLHQFALDTKYQGKEYHGQKYSDILLGYVFESVTFVAERSGCMFIGLEATDNSVPFYESYEFKTLRKKNRKILPYLIFKVADLY